MFQLPALKTAGVLPSPGILFFIVIVCSSIFYLFKALEVTVAKMIDATWNEVF